MRWIHLEYTDSFRLSWTHQLLIVPRYNLLRMSLHPEEFSKEKTDNLHQCFLKNRLHLRISVVYKSFRQDLGRKKFSCAHGNICAEVILLENINGFYRTNLVVYHVVFILVIHTGHY